MVDIDPGTWTCHVCHDERPDAQISVYTSVIPMFKGRTEIKQNVRYCNDRQSCIDGAPKVKFLTLEP
jgi:hypothetical protein